MPLLDDHARPAARTTALHTAAWRQGPGDAAAMPGGTRLKERHEYTYLHSVSVCGLMIGRAHALELDAALIPEIGLAVLLHDIGKARGPNLLLDKPVSLTDEE